MRTNHFQAFGLLINSTIPLPELVPYTGEETPGVNIHVGTVPSHLENPSLTGVLFEVKGNQFLLRIEGVAAYLAEDGVKVMIDPVPGADEREIRLFLYTSVFGAVLHQRGILPLHASSVVKDNRAYVFMGPSGSGKSTLAAAFQKRGYRLLADDITVVSVVPPNPPTAIPGYPGVKLWRDAMDHLDLESNDAIRIREKMEKYTLPSQDFLEEPVPIKAIYRLGIVNNESEASLQPVKGCDKLSFLTGNTYRGRFLKGMAIGNRHFLQANTFARIVRMVSLKRANDLGQLKDLLDLLEEDFHR